MRMCFHEDKNNHMVGGVKFFYSLYKAVYHSSMVYSNNKVMN